MDKALSGGHQGDRAGPDRGDGDAIAAIALGGIELLVGKPEQFGIGEFALEHGASDAHRQMVRCPCRHEHRFHWIALDSDGFDTFNLKPSWLPEVLRRLPDQLTHIVFDERADG